jgi:hypothetical protein
LDNKQKVSDDKLMLGALGVCAYVIADVIHEAIGHGGTCILSGGSISLLSSAFFRSNNGNTLVDIGGPIANILAGILSLFLLNSYKNFSVRTRYFLILLMAFNLFWGTGGLIYSGVTGKDDWSYLITGLQPVWLWRVILVVTGVALYYGSIRIVAAKMLLIFGKDSERKRKLVLVPYLAAGVSACFAALFDLFGSLPAIKEDALETFVGFIGLLLILRINNKTKPGLDLNLLPVTRNMKWIISIAMLYLIFIVVMGHGIKFNP